MKRTFILLGFVACSKSGDGSKPFTHTSPAFALDVPGGYQVQPETSGSFGGRQLRFVRPGGDIVIVVDWDASAGTAVEERDQFVKLAQSARTEITGQGNLPGGGAWYETATDVFAFLDSDGQTVTCATAGPASSHAACKTLRGK